MMNLRVRYPLWNIVSLIPLFLIGCSIIIREGLDKDSPLSIFLEKGIFIEIVLLVFILGVYILTLNSFNKKYPKQKINPFSFHPNEYIEDDEMFKQITMHTTKKVYTFMSVAIPFLFGLTIFATKLMIFIGIFIIITIQNLIFYNEMKRYTSE